MTKENEVSRNPFLYQYVGMAYEYVKELGGSAMEGDAASAVEQLQRRRLEYVLGISLGDINLEVKNRPRLAEQVEQLLERRDLVLTQGQIADFAVPAVVSDEFQVMRETYEQAFENDQANELKELGLDAYATYLPIHFFFTPDRATTDWGVYISEPKMLRLAAKLTTAFHSAFGPPANPPGDSGFIELAYQILLRHELMHFKIESFALNAEMASGKPLYVPYLKQVYIPDYLTEDCLEEGLANAAIINSEAIDNFVSKRLYPAENRPDPEKKVDWMKIVMDQFLDHQQPAGYRNYDLDFGPHVPTRRQKDYKARREAVNYVSNQIITGEHRPTKIIPFYAYPPDNYFLRAEHLVPIHIVRSLDETNTFIESLKVPTCRLWKRFLTDLGYGPTDQGKGDHVVWKGPQGWGYVTVNCFGKELDPNSYKSGLKALKLKPKDFQDYVQSRKLPLITGERAIAW